MKKIFIFFICINFLSGCKSIYYFNFENNDASIKNMKLDFWAIESLCFEKSIINNSNNSNNRILDIEYIDGFLKIGEEKISFKKNEITICIVMNGHRKYSMFGIEKNGNTIISEDEKQEYFNYISGIRFFKDLDYKSQKTIYKLYILNNKLVNVYFEYKIKYENDVVHYIVNEEFILEAEKNIYFFYLY